ncbi:MAG: RDD family protein [Chitinophagaceae bacterium]
MINVGIGTRVLNFIVDTLLIFLLSFAAFKGWQFYSYYWGIIYFPFYYFFWSIIFIYYLFFESIFKRTPGKWLSFSKVVSKNGGKPSFIQIVLRSLIRLTIIDCFFIPFLDETLHDYVSKTKVVEV